MIPSKPTELGTINTDDHHLHNHYHRHCDHCHHAATSEADSAGYPRLGFVHRETTPVVILIVESLDRCLSLGVGVHLDETEPLAASRFSVWMTWALCTVPNGVNHPCRSEEVAESVRFPTYSFFPTRFSLWLSHFDPLVAFWVDEKGAHKGAQEVGKARGGSRK